MEWLKKALATIYERDGLLGLVITIAMILVTLVTIVYFKITPATVVEWFGG